MATLSAVQWLCECNFMCNMWCSKGWGRAVSREPIIIFGRSCLKKHSHPLFRISSRCCMMDYGPQWLGVYQGSLSKSVDQSPPLWSTPDWNNSTAIGCYEARHRHSCSSWMNPTDVSDPLTFDLAPKVTMPLTFPWSSSAHCSNYWKLPNDIK